VNKEVVALTTRRSGNKRNSPPVLSRRAFERHVVEEDKVSIVRRPARCFSISASAISAPLHCCDPAQSGEASYPRVIASSDCKPPSHQMTTYKASCKPIRTAQNLQGMQHHSTDKKMRHAKGIRQRKSWTYPVTPVRSVVTVCFGCKLLHHGDWATQTER